MIKKLKSYFTMKFVSFAFTDSVDGKRVNYYIDCHGDKYMKNYKFGLFSVKVK